MSILCALHLSWCLRAATSAAAAAVSAPLSVQVLRKVATVQAQRHAAGTPYSWRNSVRYTAPFGNHGNCTRNAGFFCAQESQLQKESLVFEFYYPSVVAESCSMLKTPSVASLGSLSTCTEGTQNSCSFVLACMWFCWACCLCRQPILASRCKICLKQAFCTRPIAILQRTQDC